MKRIITMSFLVSVLFSHMSIFDILKNYMKTGDICFNDGHIIHCLDKDTDRGMIIVEKPEEEVHGVIHMDTSFW